VKGGVIKKKRGDRRRLTVLGFGHVLQNKKARKPERGKVERKKAARKGVRGVAKKKGIPHELPYEGSK